MLVIQKNHNISIASDWWNPHYSNSIILQQDTLRKANIFQYGQLKREAQRLLRLRQPFNNKYCMLYSLTYFNKNIHSGKLPYTFIIIWRTIFIQDGNFLFWHVIFSYQLIIMYHCFPLSCVYPTKKNKKMNHSMLLECLAYPITRMYTSQRCNTTLKWYSMICPFVCLFLSPFVRFYFLSFFHMSAYWACSI